MPRRPLVLALAAALGAPALGMAVAGCVTEAQPGVSGADDQIVATVGDGAVTAGEFAEAYATTVLRAGTDRVGPAEARQAADAVLESLVARRLLIEAAEDDGVAETAAYAEARALAETKALVDLYTAQEMAPELRVTDADLREQFVRAHTTYRARHLYARTRGAAEALKARLDAGETFGALAAETFADSALAASGGSLGEFGHDEMDPALEAAAFALELGEVSDPIRTATGFSVLRVDARAASPLLTESAFAEMRPRLRRYVRKRNRTEARFALGQRTRDALAPRFDDAAFERLVAFASGAAPDLDADARQAWLQTPLVAFTSSVLGAGAWTVGDVERRAATMTARQREAVQDAASLREFIEGLLVREELAARARAAGLDADDRFARAVARRMDAWVFDEAKRRLSLTVEAPADSVAAYYAAHADAYRLPERVRAAEVLVATRAEADALAAELRAGADFGALAAERSVRLGAARTGGDLGLVSAAQLGRLAEPVWAAAPGEVVGPVEVEGRYALVLRGEAVPGRAMTLAEARPEIRRLLDADYAAATLADAVAALRARYPVEVHAPVLERVLDAAAPRPTADARAAPPSPDRL